MGRLNPDFRGYPDSGSSVDRLSWGKCGGVPDAAGAPQAGATVSARYSCGLRIPSAECGARVL